MHTALGYTSIGVCMIALSKQAYNHNENGCLTWDIRSNRLILTCRLTHFSIPVSIIDNHEQEYIKCSLKGKINNCISRHTSKSILIDHSINTITLTIRKINESNVDGKWRCKQGNNDYETAVSTAKGIISATDIYLNGEIMNTGTTKKVKLKCYSCREPRKNYMEILINGSSVDGISYNKTIDKCSHRDGECKIHVCACHRSGNEFIRIVNVTSVYGTHYSCDMRFNDEDKESIFSMKRSLYINDTVFYNTTELRLIKPSSRGSDMTTRTKDTDNSNEEDIKLVEKKWIGILSGSLISVLPLALLMILVVLHVTKKKGSGKSKNNADQSDPLLRESKESSPKSGTEGEGEMNEKAVDNKDRDGKPSDKATEPTTSETNTEEIGDKTAYVENKSSDKTKQTIRDEVKSFKLVDEATTSEYGSYISYENVVQNNSDEQPEEVPGSAYISEDDIGFNLAEDETTTSGYDAKVVQNNFDDQQQEVPGSENISESTLQKDVKKLNSAEDETTTSGYDAKVVQNNFDGQQQEVPGSEDISESTLQKDVKKLNSAEDETTTSGYGAKFVQNNFNEQQEEVSGSEDNYESTLQKDVKELNSAEGETTTSGYGAKVVQNNFDEQREEVPGSADISESTLQKDVKELNSAEGETTTSGYGAKVVQNNFDEHQEEVPGSADISESTLQKDVKELNSAEGTEEILNITSNVRQKCVKTSSDVPACYLCHDCEEAVCECCKENHFQRHQFEKISSPLILMKITNCCGNHHNQEFQWFCKDHYSLCCVKCLIGHRGCLNIATIVDASKGFKSHKVFHEYKKFLKTISKSFGNLKKILIKGKNDVPELKYNHQSDIERNIHHVVESSQQKSFKEKYLEKVKDDKNTCLLELQKQISIVTNCETDINTIETSFERMWEQLPNENLFLMVHLSMKFLESTYTKAISDSEIINLVFTRMKVGNYVIIETHEKILPQNLKALLVKQELADDGTQNEINSFPLFY